MYCGMFCNISKRDFDDLSSYFIHFRVELDKRDLEHVRCETIKEKFQPFYYTFNVWNLELEPKF